MVLTGKAIIPTLKFLAIVGLVALLVWTVKGIYEDQAELRDNAIKESVQRAVADRKVAELTVINRRLEVQDRERLQELAAARQAVQSLKDEFSDIKRSQQTMHAQLRGIDRDLATKPAAEVEATANQLTAELLKGFEEVYP